MRASLNSLIVSASDVPFIGGNRLHLKTGVITITEQGLGLVCEYYMFGSRQFNILFADIDSYSIGPWGLTITHHGSTCPRFVRIKAPVLRGTESDQDLSTLLQTLEHHQIQSKSSLASGITAKLLMLFLILLCICMYFWVYPALN